MFITKTVISFCPKIYVVSTNEYHNICVAFLQKYEKYISRYTLIYNYIIYDHNEEYLDIKQVGTDLCSTKDQLT